MKINVSKSNGINIIELSSNKMKVKLLDLGATVYEILLKDENQFDNVVLTHHDINDYKINTPYFGSTVGPTAGRISNSSYKLNGKTISLDDNNFGNCLHGGSNGFHLKYWGYDLVETKSSVGVIFKLEFDADKLMGSGYVTAMYTLNESNELRVDHNAQFDKDVLLNMANHTYFNLSGNYKSSILDHQLMINADEYIATNTNMLPISKKPVNEVMDFRIPKAIGKDINDSSLQKHPAKGYDNPWMLCESVDASVELINKENERVLQVYTSYPSVVVYTANYPFEGLLKPGIVNEKYMGICLETQYEPDGVNHRNLNDAILASTDIYNEYTIFNFIF